jgi:ankyrin repeat protein
MEYFMNFKSVSLALLVLGMSQSAFAMEVAANRRLIMGASGYGIDMVKQALEDGADINCINKSVIRSWTALHYACNDSNMKLVKLLLERGADVNCRNESGDTALDFAKEIVKEKCRWGGCYGSDRDLCCYCEIVELFSPDHANDDLCLAALSGDLSKAKDALMRGADINYGRGHETPLHLASSSGREAIVRLLLDSGADINSKNYFGETSLHKACQGVRSKEIVKLLLERGVNLDCKDNFGKTALDIAMWPYGYHEIVELITAEQIKQEIQKKLKEELLQICKERLFNFLSSKAGYATVESILLVKRK